MRAMQMRGWMLASGFVIVLGATGAWLMHRGQTAADGLPGAAAHRSGWDVITGTADTAAPARGTAQAVTPDQIRARLFKQGSFAGTEPSGNWCVASAKLTPCPDLRVRFEYYILGLGEVTIDDVKTLVADEARKANGDEIASQIMAIWDKYWQLRTYPWRNKFDQADRSTWMAVFEEQKTVRRQLLGAEWARAFFDQDEHSFQQYYARMESGQPPPADPGEPVPQMAPGKDAVAVRAERVARYGEAAADRLAKADEEWADWERRLAAARTEWDRLKNATNLSEPQRKQDMQAYVDAHFKSDEHLRVQALLHL